MYQANTYISFTTAWQQQPADFDYGDDFQPTITYFAHPKYASYNEAHDINSISSIHMKRISS